MKVIIKCHKSAEFFSVGSMVFPVESSDDEALTMFVPVTKEQVSQVCTTSIAGSHLAQMGFSSSTVQSC